MNKVTMKRYLVLITVLIGIIVCVFVSMPNLTISNLNLGVYAPGKTYKGVLTFTNDSLKSVEVYNVQTCCGIALPDGFPKKIRAKSSVSVILDIQTPVSYEKLKRTIVVHNNSKNPRYEVDILGEPDISVQVLPASVDLGFVGTKVKLNKVASVVVDEGIQILHLTTSSPFINASIQDSDGSYSVSLEISEKIPFGKFEEYLYMKTNFEKKRNIVLPISGYIEKGLKFRPLQIFFNIAGKDKVMSQIIDIEITDSKWYDFQVSSPKYVTAFVPIKNREDNKVKLQIDLKHQKDQLPLKSYVTLSNSLGENIDIPLFVYKGAN